MRPKGSTITIIHDPGGFSLIQISKSLLWTVGAFTPNRHLAGKGSALKEGALLARAAVGRRQRHCAVDRPHHHVWFGVFFLKGLASRCAAHAVRRHPPVLSAVCRVQKPRPRRPRTAKPKEAAGSPKRHRPTWGAEMPMGGEGSVASGDKSPNCKVKQRSLKSGHRGCFWLSERL